MGVLVVGQGEGGPLDAAQLWEQGKVSVRWRTCRKARPSGLVVQIFLRGAPGTSKQTSRASLSLAKQATALGSTAPQPRCQARKQALTPWRVAAW